MPMCPTRAGGAAGHSGASVVPDVAAGASATSSNPRPVSHQVRSTPTRSATARPSAGSAAPKAASTTAAMDPCSEPIGGRIRHGGRCRCARWRGTPGVLVAWADANRERISPSPAVYPSVTWTCFTGGHHSEVQRRTTIREGTIVTPSRTRAGLCLAACTTLVAGTAVAGPALAAPGGATAAGGTGVVINEAYLSGGSASAVYQDKFIELYNGTDAPVSLDGWTLQYRSSTGTGTTNTSVGLSGTVPAHGYFLVGGGSNGTSGADLPTPDLSTSFNPSGTKGTIVLSTQAGGLDLPTGSVTGNPQIADLLGYGSSNTFETAAATAPSSNSDPKSLERTDHADTDNNAADFHLNGAPSPTASGGTAPDPGTDPDPAEPVDVSIAEIQGTGDKTPLDGDPVTTRGVVTAAYPTGGYDGYYLQTPGTGGDAGAAASDGVFVYSPDTVNEVSLGDYVEVTGTAGEFYGLTQVSVRANGATVLTEPAEAVKPLTVAWPATDAEREAYEGMLWDPSGTWTLADNYALNGYGELGLAYGASTLVPGAATLPQPTDVAPAGSDRAAAVEAENLARSVTLDDGSTANYLGADANKDIPLPYLAAGSQVRVGAPVDFIGNVILDYRHDAWRFEPLTQLTGANTADQP